MKFPRRVPHFRSLKFAPLALLFFFLFSNLTGILFSHVLAPVATANAAEPEIPADIPTSGDPQLDRIIFEVAMAKTYPGREYDFVTFFDCLHDMGDPAGASAHVRDSLSNDGTWMIVEPFAGDKLEENLNPIGRAFYGASTLLCTPASLSQEVGLALGAQAGEKRIRDVVTSGGFTRFRRATQTPFNLIFEARP